MNLLSFRDILFTQILGFFAYQSRLRPKNFMTSDVKPVWSCLWSLSLRLWIRDVTSFIASFFSLVSDSIIISYAGLPCSNFYSRRITF